MGIDSNMETHIDFLVDDIFDQEMNIGIIGNDHVHPVLESNLASAIKAAFEAGLRYKTKLSIEGLNQDVEFFKVNRRSLSGMISTEVLAIDTPQKLDRMYEALSLALHAINEDGGLYDIPNLEDDEPFFILRGKDHLFVPLVEAWANLRSGHVTMGKNALDQVYTHASQIEAQSNSDPQIISAFHKANEGRVFQRAQALKPNPVLQSR